MFKGTDVHSGVAPRADAEKYSEWEKSILDAMWNLAGPQNRLGYVIYLGVVPSKRLGSLNVTPPSGFGNYGSSAVHKVTQKNFANHGHTTMGSPNNLAARLGREAVCNFYNTLRLCGLSSSHDVDDLLRSISFIHPATGEQHGLGPFPYHPIKDETTIRKNLALFKWHSSESNLFNLHITNAMIRSRMSRSSSSGVSSALLFHSAVDLPELHEGPLEIDEVLEKHFHRGKVGYFRIFHQDDYLTFSSGILPFAYVDIQKYSRFYRNRLGL